MKFLSTTLFSIAFKMGDDTTAIAKGATNHLRRGNFYDKRSLMPKFPPYSQQCTDDAGPPFQDDDATYGSGGKYHDGKPAVPIGDSCPDPLKEACRTKSKKAAFLEGPVDCGDKGWFCRIEEEIGWPANNLISDLNFGYCNTQEGFEDAGFDRAGHCHGSDADETFYWWVRDHWFRGYNGKMRCCCGWDTIVKTGSIVNRCDHRRLVKPTENLDQCRDANEDGATPYNEGCAANGPFTIGQPIDEDDSQCWEISKFGEPADDVVEDNEGGGDDEQEDDEGGDDNEEDEGIEENENQDDNENNQSEENEGGNDEDDENSENENENEDQDEDDIEGNENVDQDDNEIQNQDNEDNQNDEDENNSGNDEETEDNEVENNPGNNEEIENNEIVNEENIFDENDIQEEDKCVDVKGKFVFKKKKKKKCSWAAKKLKKFKKKNKEKKMKKFCTKKKTSEGVTIGTHCPVTCGLC